MCPLSPYHPSDIGVILSYKCQAGCAHCIYNGGPEWTEWMSREDIRLALEAMPIWKHPFQVHFTGGEPFLNFPLLEFAVETAGELGITCYVETNAGWCTDEQRTAQRFADLRDAGLAAVLISCSPFHASAIPLQRTLTAIRTARDVFGPGRVLVYTSEWVDFLARLDPRLPVPLEQIVTALGREEAGRLFWQGYGLIAGGRAGYRLGHLVPKRPAEAFRGQACRSEVLYTPHSHFDLYGNYISGFCGGLSVGTWRDLPQVIANARNNEFPPLVRILIESGPYGLFEYAQKEGGYQALPAGYAGKCHLCVDVRRHLVCQGNYAELKPEGFYRQLE